jgi:hypothetical protein
VNVIVNLPAVRPGRLAASFRDEVLDQTVRELRAWLRDARREPLTDGVRLRLQLDVGEIAALADQVRALADVWPFLTFRLLADPPECWLEVTGTGSAAELARAVFGEIAV